jgi:hypothetical protein
MNINLELTVEEVNIILQALGELPTKSAAYLLVLKVKEQGDAQLRDQEASNDEKDNS